MCGICGFIGQGDLGTLSGMMAPMTHRGPDGKGNWVDPDDPVFFGHRRLSIVDLETGTQPMSTQDGDLCVVFNGEIYNHVPLRQELEGKGHRFASDHSDTEVLLYGYREWGQQLVERLNGMWAFALYDRPLKRLWLSRDRFGKKPLFYALRGETFVFASELSALAAHPTVESRIDRLALKKYFAHGYVPAPRSIYKDVYKLPAGHNLVIDAREMKPRVDRYWRLKLEPFETVPDNAEAVWGEEIRERLYQAVRLRMVADVPVGVFLSGGVDSSSVISLAISASMGHPVQTFSIGFEEASFDESAYSKEIAGILGTRHRVETLSAKRSLDLLTGLVEGLDEPLADSSLVPSYLLCKVARQDAVVALGGDGSDELFAGYDPFRALRPASLYARAMPRFLHRGVSRSVSWLPVSHRNMSFDFKLKRMLAGLSFTPDLWNPVWLGPLAPHQIEALFDEPTDPEELYAEALDAWRSCEQQDLINRTLQFYTELYLQNDILVKMDRAGMMNSLEVRSPYLDRDLVEFVRRIPPDFKFRDGQTKYILKRALRPVLPLEILHRPKKGFGVPIGQWFKEGKLAMDAGPLAEHVDKGFLDRAARQHRSGRADWRSFLWAAWMMDRWLGAGGAAPST